MKNTEHIYASARDIRNIDECYFYHTIELPEYGLMNGAWDLRSGADAYLGNVAFAGKRVLELGTANGFLCFEMEKRGAEVVAYDLSDNHEWDIVPFGGKVSDEQREDMRTHIRKINNAWWLTHRLLNSKASVVYGTVYDIPKEIGPVQVSTFGSILLHLRDPFLALQRASAMTTETMIVTDLMPRLLVQRLFLSLLTVPTPVKLQRKVTDYLMPSLIFIPDPERREPWTVWWYLTPSLVSRFLRILGFSDVRVNYHNQKYMGGTRRLYTVVGRKIIEAR